MAATLMLSALFAAQAITSVPGLEVPTTEQKEVAFEALSQGQADKAILALEQRLASEPDDPALLINLGSAYAQIGDMDKAAAAYRAALESSTRYQLELADGNWVDSRRAARLALQSLEDASTLATR